MPVIRQLASDPFDLVMQGEQMRMWAFGSVVGNAANIQAQTAYVAGPITNQPLIGGEQVFTPMVGGYPVPNVEVLRSIDQGSMVSNNAVISTPCGALVPFDVGNHTMNNFSQASVLWAITGVTKDYTTLSPIAGCAVDAHEVGRLAVAAGSTKSFYSAGNPNPNDFTANQSLVGKTISDGSGNYSIPVGTNVAYQLTAYKVGSPDIAGITRQDVIPTAVG